MMIIGFKKIIHKKRKAIINERSIGMQLVKLMIVLLIIIFVHSAAMVHFEGLSVGDAFWLTMTSVTTVGYGDISAATLEGRIATIILMYIGGIAILAQVAAMYFEHRQEIKNRMLRGDWSWNMENHIVFLNCPEELGEEYFYQAISGLRTSHTDMANLPIIIVCEQFKDELPDRLRKLDVVHVSKPISGQDALESASVRNAHTIVILARNHINPISDSITFELVDRIREMGVTAHVIAEAVKDENRSRLKKVGADNVLRPIRAYPELLMRAIIAPGSEQIIETLFNSNAEECIRYQVAITANWLEIIQKLTSQDLGIPIAFEHPDGQIISVPSSKDIVTTKAIYVIVNEGHHKTSKEIASLLEK